MTLDIRGRVGRGGGGGGSEREWEHIGLWDRERGRDKEEEEERNFINYHTHIKDGLLPSSTSHACMHVCM